MSCSGESLEEREGNERREAREREVERGEEVGCCGDVPQGCSGKAVVGNGGGKRKERLLEWLKSSQMKREENNRQVLARWIDMVDHGAIDLTSVYPCKPTNTTVSSTMYPSSKTFSNLPIKTSQLPTLNNLSPQYIPPPSTYYGLTQNWFAASNPQATSMYQAQSPFNVYSGHSYCPSSHILSNYYQYLPFHQQCTLCPSYVLPNTTVNVESYGESSLNMNTNKWFDVLSEIKIDSGKSKKNEETGESRDCKEELS